MRIPPTSLLGLALAVAVAVALPGMAAADPRPPVYSVWARWGRHPAGYTMVGLTAATDAAQRTLSGQIDFAGCSSIAARRVDAEAPR